MVATQYNETLYNKDPAVMNNRFSPNNNFYSSKMYSIGHDLTWPEKTANIFQYHHRFPHKMMG